MYSRIVFLGFVFFAVAYCAGATDEAPSNDGHEKIANNTSSSEDPTTPSTITPPTTHPTTPTPTDPTKPTPKPDPTPSTPTTPPIPKPTTPSPPPSSTTEKPQSDIGNWNVTVNHKTCLLFDSKIEIKLTYLDGDNKTQHYPITVPSNATVQGECENTTEFMKLQWKSGTAVSFFFASSKNEFYLKNATGKIFVGDYPELQKNVSKDVTYFDLAHNAKDNSEMFKASGDNSYVCSSPSVLSMNNDQHEDGSELVLSSLKYQAFIKNGKFGPAQNCISESPDIVPIMVAGGLILVVILVLVAYVVTRRRSRALGYLSM